MWCCEGEGLFVLVGIGCVGIGCVGSVGVGE